MKKEPIDGYIYFGACVRYLQDCEPGIKINGRGYILYNIGSFFDYLDALGLQVTQRASEELANIRDEFSKKTDKNAELTQEEASRLGKIIENIRNTLEAELAGYHAFVVTPKILDTEKLLNDVSALMRPKVFGALPEVAQYDLSEAGKCIAFERPTAAAFHLLRGTESVLRHFYCTLIQHKRIPPPLMWADMVNDLRNRLKTKKHVTLYNNLDNIRLSYRNPTQHPEKIYDIHEAQDLWPLCIEVINRMALILQEYKKKK
jgi:hypothetical protein